MSEENENLKSPPLPGGVKRESTFTNPYTLTKEDTADCVTVACSISKHDYNFLKCIRPSWGTNASVIGLLWKKLCNELNKRNITDVSNVTEFEQFVLKCHIVGDDEMREFRRRFPNGTLNGPMSETSTSNDGPGTGTACDNAPTATTIGANVQGGSGESRGRSRKGKKG